MGIFLKIMESKCLTKQRIPLFYSSAGHSMGRIPKVALNSRAKVYTDPRRVRSAFGEYIFLDLDPKEPFC